MGKEMCILGIIGYLHNGFVVKVNVMFTEHIVGADTTVVPTDCQYSESHFTIFPRKKENNTIYSKFSLIAFIKLSLKYFKDKKIIQKV